MDVVPDSAAAGRRWAGLLTLFTVAGLAETLFYGQTNAFTPIYLQELGLGPADVTAWTGWTAAIANGVGLIFLPFWGALADRYARQPLIVRSFAVLWVAAGGMALSESPLAFLAARALTALALGNSGLMMTTLSERAPLNRHGLAFSIMNGAAPIGAFLGPLVGGPIVDRFGFRSLMAVDAVVLFMITLMVAFGYRDAYRGRSTRPVLHMARDSLILLARSPRLRSLFPALFLLFGGWMMAFTYVPLAARAVYIGDNVASAVGVTMGTAGIVALVLGPLVGAAADRWGHWKVVLIGAVVTLFLWPLPALVSGFRLFVGAWGLVNGIVSSVFAVSFVLLARSVGAEERGRVMSFSYLPINVGLLIGPSLGALITQRSVFAVFPAAAALTAAGIVVLVVARRMASRYPVSTDSDS
ncbi:MAG TPA: MFS transporter [Anaerolineales bacterium]|nr:MFS transporter [Anaerolineales bacterium]